MVQQPGLDAIFALAEERAAARAAGDWRTADELKARIEAAGWRIVDDGLAFELAPARPADVVEDGLTLYGAVGSVPSRLDEPASCPATVIVIVDSMRASSELAAPALQAHLPAEAQLIVVAARSAPVPEGADEVLRTVEPFRPGDALQAGLRRAIGEVIVVLEPDRVPNGDIVSPLLAALSDDTVAIAGIEGLVSEDLRRYAPAEPGEATAVRSGCYAFRRADALSRGPIDAWLRLPGSVATWWSLELRDSGPDLPPRRALAVVLPLEPYEQIELTADHARLARRDAYGIAERMRGRDWLAQGQPPQRRFVGDGAQGHDEQDDSSHTEHTDGS